MQLPGRSHRYTHAEFLYVNDTNEIVSVVTKRLNPLRLDVFVREKFHRFPQSCPSGVTRFDALRWRLFRFRASMSRISSGLLKA